MHARHRIARLKYRIGSLTVNIQLSILHTISLDADPSQSASLMLYLTSPASPILYYLDLCFLLVRLRSVPRYFSSPPSFPDDQA